MNKKRVFTLTNKRGESLKLEANSLKEAQEVAAKKMGVYPNSLTYMNHCIKCGKMCGHYQYCGNDCFYGKRTGHVNR